MRAFGTDRRPQETKARTGFPKPQGRRPTNCAKRRLSWGKRSAQAKATGKAAEGSPEGMSEAKPCKGAVRRIRAAFELSATTAGRTRATETLRGVAFYPQIQWIILSIVQGVVIASDDAAVVLDAL